VELRFVQEERLAEDAILGPEKETTRKEVYYLQIALVINR
jgi:hypothetical protein